MLIVNHIIKLYNKYNNSTLDENTLNEVNSDKHGLILKKFVESGINLTPLMLDFISSLNDPLGFSDRIIREVSFIPKFNGHLTKHILKTISNDEIQKVLKRLSMREDFSLAKDISNELNNKKTNFELIKSIIFQLKFINIKIFL